MSSRANYRLVGKDFSLPLVGAIVVHILALGLLIGSWSVSQHKTSEFELPRNIVAKVVTLEQVKATIKPQVAAKPKPKPKPKVVTPKPKVVTPKPKVVTSKPKPKPVPVVIEPKVEAPIEKTLSVDEPVVLTVPVSPTPVPPVVEEKVVPAAPKTPAEPASTEDLFDEMLASLAAEEEEINQQKDQLEQELARKIAIKAQVGDYVLAITQQIEEKWSRPAELRLMDLADIQAVVAVEILPTGELQSASILQASGNANYDQSVLRAIEKVRRFRVPADPEVFEKGGFRRLNIIFRPEDLMKP